MQSSSWPKSKCIISFTRFYSSMVLAPFAKHKKHLDKSTKEHLGESTKEVITSRIH